MMWTVTRKLVLAFTVLVILIPIIPMMLWSVAETWTYPSLFPSELSFDNFTMLFDTYSLGKVITDSIIVSAIVTIVSILLAVMPAKFIGTQHFRGKIFVQTLTMMPVMAPAIIVLFGLMGVFVKMGIYKTFLSLVIAEAVFLVPYAIMVLVPIFKNYDSGIEDQASTLGINWLSRLLNVVLPNLKTGLMVSAMYVFMSSWAAYLAVSMFAPRTFNTVASLLYPAIYNGQYSNGMLASLTVLFFIPSIAFLFISTWIIGTDKMNNGRI